MRRTVTAGLAILGMSGAAAAQSMDVTQAADDAFGRRVGVEQVGLYSEGSVRGFDLEEAGNYRIEGSYFVRAAVPADPAIAGTVTRVGVNALRYDFPGPSGVVDYDLRRADEPSQIVLETGLRPNGPFADLNAQLRDTNGRLSASAGALLSPWQHYADGGRGDFFAIGVVPRWRPNERIELTALATRTSWRYDADIGYTVSGSFLPPKIDRDPYRGQRWTNARSETSVIGLIAKAGLPAGWSGRMSLFRAESVNDQADFNLYRVDDPEGSAQLDAFLVPRQASRAVSGEIAAERDWRTGNVAHRLVMIGRVRDSRARTTTGITVDLGRVDLGERPRRFAAPMRPDDPERTLDQVTQLTAGAGYRLSVGDQVELRADVQKSRYRRDVTAADGDKAAKTTAPWLYSGSAAVGVTSDLTAFGSYVRGLEESGVAPRNATNRNTVLPAVIAAQAELGAKLALAERLSMIGSVFRIEKPVPGLRSDGSFGFVGEARHQGVELSLAGDLTPRLSIVAGAAYLEATVADTDRNAGGRRGAVGRPEWIAQTNLTWRVPGVSGLWLDGAVVYTGSEWVDAANSVRTVPSTVMNAGLRYRFDVDGVPLTVRGRVTNLFDSFAWTATSSGLLFYSAPRSFALSLRAEL